MLETHLRLSRITFNFLPFRVSRQRTCCVGISSCALTSIELDSWFPQEWLGKLLVSLQHVWDPHRGRCLWPEIQATGQFFGHAFPATPCFFFTNDLALYYHHSIVAAHDFQSPISASAAGLHVACPSSLLSCVGFVIYRVTLWWYQCIIILYHVHCIIMFSQSCVVCSTGCF